MILILSTDGDASTDYVIEWIHYFKNSVVRLNDNDIFKTFYCRQDTPDKMFYDNREIDVSDVKVVWFRKFGFFRESAVYKYLCDGQLINKENLKFMSHLSGEYNAINELILYKLRKKRWLANPRFVKLNKMIVLEEAKNIGLNIPHYEVVGEKSRLYSLDLNRGYITKPFSQGFSYTNDSNYFKTYTNRVAENAVEGLPDFFYPSFVQKEVEKDFEIRSFFLVDRFYSMAIFSQNNPKTKVDYRDYDFGHPNRTCPYRLPKDIESLLFKLFKKLKLNTGSVDLIKDVNGVFYFLEINPAGQFGMISNPCNYNLHREVALQLINMQ